MTEKHPILICRNMFPKKELLQFLLQILLIFNNYHNSFASSRVSNITRTSLTKCCQTNQALLTKQGCIDSWGSPSPYLSHLQSIMAVRIGFPVLKDQDCKMRVLRRNMEHDFKWWINRAGRLVVDAPQGELEVTNYCIDDLLDPTTRVGSPSAVTCTHELKRKVQVPLSRFRVKTIGKCCPIDHFLSRHTYRCERVPSTVTDWKVIVPGSDNETHLGFTSFPKCSSGNYHSYPFLSETEDHVRLAENLSLIVVSMDGKYVERETPINLTDYCFEYEWDGVGKPKPITAICAQARPKKMAYHTEKKPFLVTLLSISCIALLLTLAFLIALQAKGIVHHVPQVRTF